MRAINLPKSAEPKQPPSSLKRHYLEHITAEMTLIPKKRKPSSFWLSLHDDPLVSG
jgi:hypothetical protein